MGVGGQYGGAESRPWVEEELGGGAAWEEEELAQPGGHPATTRHAARSSSVEAATIQSIHPINLFFLSSAASAPGPFRQSGSFWVTFGGLGLPESAPLPRLGFHSEGESRQIRLLQ